MDNTGSDMRSRHVDLLTQQKRLRHLRSIAVRNIRFADVSTEAGKLETFFSLHNGKTKKVFYTSEKIKGSLNPTWKSFNLGQLEEEVVNTAECSFIIRVWRGAEGQYRKIIDWNVNLFGLVYLGKKLQIGESTFQPNTVIFGLPDGFYGAPVQAAVPVVLDDVSKSLVKVDQGSVRDSYSTNSLSRIQTVLRAIKQTQVSVKRVRSSIEDELAHSTALTTKKRERELLTLRVNQMRTDLEWRTMQLQAEKDSRETQQALNHQRDVHLRNKFDTLRKDKNRLHEKKKGYFDVREDLIKTGAQLVMRRKQLIAELAHIYPINESAEGVYTVCGVRLPHSEELDGQDELMVAVSLGNTCHLVEMVSSFLDVPLRYHMQHRGSRSHVTDHILDKLSDKDRDFPLYSKGKERFQFSYGVYLLNKNIAQMRYYCGLGTTDLRMTLPNLKTLLELRLGVKFQNANSLLSGHHDSIPPNLGGPQKFSSSFASSSQNVQRDSTKQHKGTEASNSADGRSSSEDSSCKKQSKAAEVSSQAQDSNQSNSNTVVNHSIEESTVGVHTIPFQNPSKVTLDDELFKGSPDSFFGVDSVENVAQRILEMNESRSRTSSDMDPGRLVELVFEKDSQTDKSKGTSESASDLKIGSSSRDASPIGDPVPLNHKMTGTSVNDTPVPSVDESSETNYASKFGMWPATDHATIPRTDSSDLLDDFPIEKAVRKSLCEEDDETCGHGSESKSFKTSGMLGQHIPDVESTDADAESRPTEGTRDSSLYDSLATFSLTKNSSEAVIENSSEA